jgi:hypothetical protein
VRHVVAYEGAFEQVVNYADHTLRDAHWTLANHGLVLSWVIKYFLPEGRYVVIDHDCLVRPGFAAALAGLADRLDGRLFVFPEHHEEPRSLTAPMFYVDTAVRPLVADLCDAGWVGGVVCHERDRLKGGAEVFYDDGPFERSVWRNHFDDTLHNVVRHVLARRPDLAPRFATVAWPECDHVWHGATRHLRRAQVELLRRWMRDGLRPEHFDGDVGVSSTLEKLLGRLDDCGLGDEFRTRFLAGTAAEGAA